MAGPSFTRDEVILALDAFYQSPEAYPTGSSAAMVELSALLNRLPIHPASDRRQDFRTASGIAKQLERYKRSLISDKRFYQVGELFYQIVFEYENDPKAIHGIALAIRENEEFYSSEYGNRIEDIGFPEGTLLGHLHRIIEKRDGSKARLRDSCEICGLKPELYYQPCGTILEQHLLVSPIHMNGKKKYSEEHFITVCPNCHVVLHRYRPWCCKENCEDLLR